MGQGRPSGGTTRSLSGSREDGVLETSPTRETGRAERGVQVHQDRSGGSLESSLQGRSPSRGWTVGDGGRNDLQVE